jgi:cytoskeletal protein RodZ
MAEVEASTKIRAKYLRAIENEEWDLLPGPAYTKSFLRGYGDYLGLDSTMLVEEFNRRYEKPAEQERPGRDGYDHRLHVTFGGRNRDFLGEYGYRLLVAFDELGPVWLILALGLAATVVLGVLLAG